MNKKNFLGIVALAVIATSCSKTVYVPDSDYSTSYTTNSTDKESDSFYKAGKKKSEHSRERAYGPNQRPIVERGNGSYQRPADQTRPYQRPIVDNHQQPDHIVNNYVPQSQYNNDYDDFEVIEVREVVTPAQQSGPAYNTNPPNAPRVKGGQQVYRNNPNGGPAYNTNPPNAPRVKGGQQVYRNNPSDGPAYNTNPPNAPRVKGVQQSYNNTSSVSQQSQQYIYSNPVDGAAYNTNPPNAPRIKDGQHAYAPNNAPQAVVSQPQQINPFSQYFDQKVTIYFKNGAKLDGVITKHPKGADRVIINMPDNSLYEASTKDIARVEFR